jgi:hypothetical protein
VQRHKLVRLNFGQIPRQCMMLYYFFRFATIEVFCVRSSSVLIELNSATYFVSRTLESERDSAASRKQVNQSRLGPRGQAGEFASYDFIHLFPLHTSCRTNCS